MIKKPHRLGNRVPGPGKPARDRDPGTVEGGSDAELDKETAKVAASINWEPKKPFLDISMPIQNHLEYWLESRIERDSKRLVALRFPEMKSVVVKINIRDEKGGLL